ncbi:MAG: MBL fold metallo-hydrolase [Bacteroidales bacterium]|nr:MBL fold metallo-hydrolase [Bacteroidales bacterium]
MKLITLVENLVYKKGLRAEHGLSLYLEGDTYKVLFDTGQGGLFLDNAKELGIEISGVDALIISHGHYDHAGGIADFLKANSKARVFLKKESLIPKYNINRYIGFDSGVLPMDRVCFVEDRYDLNEDLHIVAKIPLKWPGDTHFGNFRKGAPGSQSSDYFEDELFLAYTAHDELSVISSCSHRGITNIVEHAVNIYDKPLNYVIGGFHIKDSSSLRINNIVKYFKQVSPNHIGVCHCTGIDQYSRLKCMLDVDIFYNCTGTELIL